MMKEKKKAHGIQLLLRCVVRDPDGKIISDTGQKPTKSFVIQFLEFMKGLFDGFQLTATAVNGAESFIFLHSVGSSSSFNIGAGAGNSGFGIVIGTGVTAEDNEDYKLEIQLTEGVGAGNITHGAVSYGDAGVAGANVDFLLSRTFTNNTGSLIGVKEAGVYTATVQPYYHCIIRDVLPGTVNVPFRCSLTLYYTLRTTV